MDNFINMESGAMHFENGVIVKENDASDDVMSLNLGKTRKTHDVTNGWFWLTEQGVPYKGKCLSITFYFFNKLLRKAVVTVRETYPHVFSDDFSEFTLEYQKKKYEYERKWFSEEIGEGGRHLWGSATCELSESGHDPNACISVDYDDKLPR